MSATAFESSQLHYEIFQNIDGNLNIRKIEISDEELIEFSYKELRKSLEIKRCICEEIWRIAKHSNALTYSHSVIFKIISTDNEYKKFEVRLLHDGFDLRLVTIINVIN
jgi:hypothetical protein